MKVPDVLALAPGDPLRHILEPQGIKTLITMPLMDGPDCVGFIGLDYVRAHHDFTVWEEKLLTMFARMLVNARSRFRMEREISESRNFLDTLIENSPSVFFIKDEAGKYLRVNRRWTEVAGLTAEDTLGKTDGDLFPEGTSPRILPSGNEAEGIRHIEERVVFETGPRHFLTVEFPVKGSDPGSKWTVGIRTDITQLKKIEEVRLARERAEAAIQEKDLFLAKMSHEIQTPLNGILGFSNLVARGLADADSDLREKIRMVQRSAEHLSAMINDMLEYARLGSGRLELVPSRFMLREILNDLALYFRLRAEEAGLGFSFVCGDELNVAVHSDLNKFRQILFNLLGNALKFTDRGTVALRATCLERDEVRLRVCFEVEDSGCGIADADVKNIFREYYQGEAGKNRSGTGLGLSIANHLAELMGGDGIRLVRTGKQGSLFQFELVFPLLEPQGDALDQVAAPMFAVPGASSGAETPGRIDLSGLSRTERSELLRCLEEGEMAGFRRRFSEIKSLDRQTLKGVFRLASRYDYPALFTVLSQEPPLKPPA
jgi:PAS domain S-box-containing protein